MGFNPFIRKFLTLGVIAASFLGCGYSLQTSRNELLEKEGIRRVYVRPLINSTYKPGVENLVYNALIRTLLAHRRVQLVGSEREADAVLRGTVDTAQFSASGSTTANTLPPFGLSVPNQLSSQEERLKNISVASVYTAVLACTFELVREKPAPGQKAMLWNAGFSRSRPFPASNLLDVPGTTSALINESEFERALNEMASSMMADVHESMLAMF